MSGGSKSCQSGSLQAKIAKRRRSMSEQPTHRTLIDNGESSEQLVNRESAPESWERLAQEALQRAGLEVARLELDATKAGTIDIELSTAVPDDRIITIGQELKR